MRERHWLALRRLLDRIWWCEQCVAGIKHRHGRLP